MKPFDINQVKLRKTVTVDRSVPKLKADVEDLSSDHDQIFMSFNIEHWYPVLGPTKTAATKFLPITRPVAVELVALHDSFKTTPLQKREITLCIQQNPILAQVAAELQLLISPGGAFIKTSARSCKDIALQIGLADRYRELVAAEITSSGNRIDEMKLRSLFMEAGRQVLRFTNASDSLVACILSERISGDIHRALKDDFSQPLSFVVREWMPVCPPEFEFRCVVTNGNLNAIGQYCPTIYSPTLNRLKHPIRESIMQYFAQVIQAPLSTLYDRYAVDIVLLNVNEDQARWKMMVIEINPFFELTGEGLFESEDGRKILNGEAEAEYPVMRVQEMRMVDNTEKTFLDVRRQVERELGVKVIR